MNIMNLNGEIYIRISYLENYGIKSTTINNRLCENRKGKTNNYQHFEDPKDKRVKWVRYSSIPSQTFKKYNLPIPEQLLNGIENQKKTKIEELISKSLYHAYEKDYIHYVKFYHGVFFEKEAIESYAKTHAIFNSMANLKINGIGVKEIFKVYQEFDDLEFNCKSLKSFYNKLSHFEKEGQRVFIHKSYRKVLTKRKITDKHINEVEKHFRKMVLLTNKEIHEKVNQWAILNGYSQLSIASIKRIISDPHFQNKNRVFRNGKEWAEKNFEPFRLRLNPEFNGTLWQLDGSRLQIAFLNEKGIVSYYHLFVVMDVHSRKIIGFSFDKSENHNMVISALKMAIETTGYVPKELLRDNGACFSPKPYKYIEKYMTYLRTYIRKHKVAHPRDKAQVERFFGKFQSTIQKEIPGYIGEGVKSRRMEGHVPKEIKDNIDKGIGIHTVKEMDLLIPELIERYNEYSSHENEHCPRLKFEIAKLDPQAFNVFEQDLALMFWEKRKKLIKQSMIILSEGSNREKQFQYIIEDQELRLSLNLTEVSVCFQRTDRSKIKIYDEHDNWIADVKLTPKISSVYNRGKEEVIKPIREISLRPRTSVKNKKLEQKNQLFKKSATLKVFTPKTDNDE